LDETGYIGIVYLLERHVAIACAFVSIKFCQLFTGKLPRPHYVNHGAIKIKMGIDI
jgi:hypothetical protein